MRRAFAALTALLAVSCSGPSPKPPTAPGDIPGTNNAVTPIPTVHPLVGIWTGSAQVMTCSGPVCSEWVSQPEPPDVFHLTVIDQGGSFTALLDTDTRPNLTVELFGVAQPDGSIRFHGSTRPPASLAWQTADVHAFEIRVDPESGLAGSFNYSTIWKTGTSTVTGRILGAKRRQSLPTEECGNPNGRSCFTGTWEGWFIVRTLHRCVDCENTKVGREERFNLTLVEEDGLVRGTVLVHDFVPLSGQRTGTHALFSGMRPTVACGYPGFDVTVLCSEVIEDLSVSLDQYGRMSGTLRYSREGWDGNYTGTFHHGFDATGELWNVVRVK